MPLGWPNRVRARVRKRGREWHAWNDGGEWLGCSSHWRVALALALGESWQGLTTGH